MRGTARFGKYGVQSFRLLTEYHSFLYDVVAVNHNLGVIEFPSPYGVSFILITFKNTTIIKNAVIEFPSPYGVSFILIYDKNKYKAYEKGFPSPYGVSFILIYTFLINHTKF